MTFFENILECNKELKKLDKGITTTVLIQNKQKQK